MKIVTVKKEQLARADWSITLIENGRQIKKDEISGDAGEAAAAALNMKARSCANRIVGCMDVMNIINAS